MYIAFDFEILFCLQFRLTTVRSKLSLHSHLSSVHTHTYTHTCNQTV